MTSLCVCDRKQSVLHKSEVKQDSPIIKKINKNNTYLTVTIDTVNSSLNVYFH